MTPDTDSILTRLQEVEDRLAIYQVIAAYGPAVDSCEYETNETLWTDDCRYEVDGSGNWEGHPGLRGLLQSDRHQSYVAAGCAHVASLPYVLIKGTDAYATNYHQLIMNKDNGFQIIRLTASRWHLQKKNGTWKIKKRTNILLDGKASAKQLLADAHNEKTDAAQEPNDASA